MSGLAGSFFRELSDTMQITMAASFLVTWLLLPVLHPMIGCKKRLRPRNLDTPQPDGKKTEETELKRWHGSRGSTRKPWVAVVFVLVLLSGGWLAFHADGDGISARPR